MAEVHTAQAGAFAGRYRTLAEDPYRSAFHYGRQQILHSLDRWIPTAHGACALDAGCGSGFWLDWLADRGYTAHGCDASSGMIEEAARSHGAGRLAMADVRALPYRAASFDVAISIEVIRYLPNPESALVELHRVIRPGGRVVVTAAPLFATHGYALVNLVTSRVTIPTYTPVRQYFTTASGLRTALRSAGFRDVEVRGRFLGPFVWLDRIAPRVSRALLRRWSAVDAIVEGWPLFGDITNHLVATATR